MGRPVVWIVIRRWVTRAMDFNTGVSLGTLMVTVAGVLAASGVAWGSLLQRVRSLEREVQTLSGFAERLTRIEEQTGFIKEEVGKITGSWLFREPPGYDQVHRAPGSQRK